MLSYNSHVATIFDFYMTSSQDRPRDVSRPTVRSRPPLWEYVIMCCNLDGACIFIEFFKNSLTSNVVYILFHFIKLYILFSVT